MLFLIKISWHKNINQYNLYQSLIIRNVTSEPNQHIKMISEGSCDTEHLSNNAALHHRNKLDWKLENIIIFLSITIFLHFLSNKCIHGEHKCFPLKKYH